MSTRGSNLARSLFVVALLVCGATLMAQPTTAPATAVQEKMSFLQLLLKGGWFMVPIAATSLVGVALVIERLLALRRRRIIPPRFMRGLLSLAPARTVALDYCRNNESPLARIVAAGLRKLPAGEAPAERAMEDAGAIEVHRLRKHLRMMYGVSVVAPMLGLLGTVSGMIEAFRVTTTERGLGRPELLATGIYEALVTTMAGLVVAIPVLMFYYYFVSKVENFVAEFNDASARFFDAFVHRAKGEPRDEILLRQ